MHWYAFNEYYVITSVRKTNAYKTLKASFANMEYSGSDYVSSKYHRISHAHLEYSKLEYLIKQVCFCS